MDGWIFKKGATGVERVTGWGEVRGYWPGDDGPDGSEDEPAMLAANDGIGDGGADRLVREDRFYATEREAKVALLEHLDKWIASRLRGIQRREALVRRLRREIDTPA